MNYNEALRYIHSVSSLGSIPGLERIRELLNLMGNPQKELRFIQIAGTNGKGSTTSMLSSVLSEAGFKVGVYTSPFILFFNERIAIGGEMISDEDLAEITTYTKSFADKMSSRPTEFELITAIGFEYFKREKCDIVVLEAGMGGRYDATNIVENTVLSIITGISLDHTDYLGNTTEKIAWEKAGIIKNGAPVIFGGVDKDAEAVIRAEAEKQGSEFIKLNREEIIVNEASLSGTSFNLKEFKDLHLSLLGEFQPINASVVTLAYLKLKDLGFNLTEENLREGLFKTHWKARMEILNREPLIIYDGGHNPEGVLAATNSIKTLLGDKKAVVLTGVMKDKDYNFIAKTLSEISEKVFTVKPFNPRALGSKEYAEVFNRLGVSAEATQTLNEGVEKALAFAKENRLPLFISGSLYMYQEVYNKLKELL